MFAWKFYILIITIKTIASMTESMESNGSTIRKCCPVGQFLKTKKSKTPNTYCSKYNITSKLLYYNNNTNEPIDKTDGNFEEDGEVLTNVIILRNGSIIEFDHKDHYKTVCNDYCVDFTKHTNVIKALANRSECFQEDLGN